MTEADKTEAEKAPRTGEAEDEHGTAYEAGVAYKRAFALRVQTPYGYEEFQGTGWSHPGGNDLDVVNGDQVVKHFDAGDWIVVGRAGRDR